MKKPRRIKRYKALKTYLKSLHPKTETAPKKKTKKKKYKTGWHTTWEGKKIWLRSGAEFRFAKILDRDKISYEYESLIFFYFDSQKKKIRKGIPDFYIPSKNLIVEIKGKHLYDPINIKDREDVYKSKGYNFQLIIDG